VGNGEKEQPTGEDYLCRSSKRAGPKPKKGKGTGRKRGTPQKRRKKTAGVKWAGKVPETNVKKNLNPKNICKGWGGKEWATQEKSGHGGGASKTTWGQLWGEITNWEWVDQKGRTKRLIRTPLTS